ncbi:glycosyl hydrolase [Spirosoma areae]
MTHIYLLDTKLSPCRRLPSSFLLAVVLLFGSLPVFGADPIRVEAESGMLSGVDIATTVTGFSGTGYVTGFDNATDQLSMTLTAAAGLYELTIGYRSPFGDKGIDFQLNDTKGTGMLKQTSTGFGTFAGGKFLLKGGQTTVTIYRGWGYFDIDYIVLTPATVQLPAAPPKRLTDALATPSTVGLFSYIVDQYGHKVISGQQDDVEYVLEKTGKEPAIGSFDLIDYSPSRVQNGSKPVRTSEACIQWAQKGEGRGIISLMWHWNAPTDLINQAPDKLWWRGFYTEATTFDLAAALADKNGQRYKLLLSDIDAIAVELKKFQAADVPVLWRPLHEAPGGWFWWGAKGAAPFNELWRLLYDRLINHHQLHNLIWVYTATDTVNSDWYPGDAYVDVVGLDIYATPAATLSGNWESALAQFNGKKLVTLSETGNLPLPDAVRGLATWWSWFSVWTGADYIKKQPIDQLKAVFLDADVITRDELPDWRKITPLVVTGLELPFQLTILGNPAGSDQLRLQIEGAANQPLTFRLTDVTGRQRLEQTALPTSSITQYELPFRVETGVYFLQVSSRKAISTFRIIKL